MKTLIKVEEAAQFVLSIFLFAWLPFAWWVFPALLLVPDLSMMGYAINNRMGAFMYNTFHHKALAILMGILGFYFGNNLLLLAGIILFGHSAMDRMFGYGLKFKKGFGYTHLGEIGEGK